MYTNVTKFNTPDFDDFDQFIHYEALFCMSWKIDPNLADFDKYPKMTKTP